MTENKVQQDVDTLNELADKINAASSELTTAITKIEDSAKARIVKARQATLDEIGPLKVEFNELNDNLQMGIASGYIDGDGIELPEVSFARKTRVPRAVGNARRSVISDVLKGMPVGDSMTHAQIVEAVRSEMDETVNITSTEVKKMSDMLDGIDIQPDPEDSRRNLYVCTQA